eukprot:TRINITY_DN24794_c0_g1_i1.p1 TRINITY_DN24794_c0_g1~~TRINITY_DN24794_c0_g1_i1.p1  ORF type:complete len:427 (+),score=91.32 TRINITY_DN24794_c0_g1_i1:113-1393(+)
MGVLTSGEARKTRLLAFGRAAVRLCCGAGRLADRSGEEGKEAAVSEQPKSQCAAPADAGFYDEADEAWSAGFWGLWEVPGRPGCFAVRLKIGEKELRRCFNSRSAAELYKERMLKETLDWPKQPLGHVERSTLFDHGEDLEERKEYVFREVACNHGQGGGNLLSSHELQLFDEQGYLVGLPVLNDTELEAARSSFDRLLASRVDHVGSEELKFRAAHTMPRPLHQELVGLLVENRRILDVVEDILGPRFVCWSAHLFCKLPGDPTVQPFHQDAGFWPLSQSRALTVWVALDDVDEANAGLVFVKGSHRCGKLGWRRTDAQHFLLPQEIPDPDVLGPRVVASLSAGECSVHSDLTMHYSPPNTSTRRRAGLALRFVQADTECLGPMLNGYQMNAGCILPKGQRSDRTGHWKATRRKRIDHRKPRQVK